MKKNLSDIIDNNFEKEIEDLSELIRMESVLDENGSSAVYPFGQNAAACLESFLQKASDMGFEVKNLDNAAGWAEIGSGDVLYGILAHLDTMPAGDPGKWSLDPFSGAVENGAVHGRGAADDKGPAVAALYAMKAVLESGMPLKARFRLILGLDEETAFRCVERYLKTEEVPVFSFSPDASFPVINGEKGILQFSMKRTFSTPLPGTAKLLGIKGGDRFNVVPDSASAYFGGNTAKISLALEEIDDTRISAFYEGDLLEVKASGRSTHAMHPERGENAIQILLRNLSKLDFTSSEVLRWIKSARTFLKEETDGSSLGISASDDISGELTLNLAAIRFDGKDLILRFDVRYPVTANPEEMENKIKNAAKKLGMIPRLDQHKKPVYVPSETREIKVLINAYEEITGEKGGTLTIGGGTYCKAFPNSVSFGALFPGEKESAHEPNELMKLESLKKATLIYAKAIAGLNALK